MGAFLLRLGLPLFKLSSSSFSPLGSTLGFSHATEARMAVSFFSSILLLFLGVGKHFRLLMQSCRFLFFFSLPFHENFKFLKKCPYEIHTILHSHSTPKGAPACSKVSKPYHWNERNIAKISPKTAIFRLFSNFSKTVHTIRTKISTVIFYTIVWSMCTIAINSCYCDWSGSEGKRPKLTPLPHMRLWSSSSDSLCINCSQLANL